MECKTLALMIRVMTDCSEIARKMCGRTDSVRIIIPNWYNVKVHSENEYRRESEV